MVILSTQQIATLRKLHSDHDDCLDLLNVIELLQNKPILDGLMGVEEAANRWQLEQSTIKKYCQAGKIPAIKISNTWIIDRRANRPLRYQFLEV